MTYLTEEQAREKRCCGPEGCGGPALSHQRWCIGRECMAWQWIDEETAPPNAEWKRLEDEMRRGYCGLARRPE